MKKGALHFALLAGLAIASTAQATTTNINVSIIRASSYMHSGMTVDAVTGEAYELTGYGPDLSYGGTSPTTLKRYTDVAAFEAGTPSGTVTSSTNLWGTYIAAQNGNVFGRASTTPNYPSDAKTTKISGSTGATQLTVSIGGMGGVNGEDTFDWGGFSGANAMNDGTRLYIVGGDDSSSNNWRISTFDYNLNPLSSVTYVPTNYPGWGFVINNHIFFGDNFNSGHISSRVNATTGAVDAVDYTLTGFGPSIYGAYLNNVSYDVFNDALYLHSDGSFYKVSNASQAFAVPEPETYSMMLAGLGLVGAAVRRRKQAEARDM